MFGEVKTELLKSGWVSKHAEQGKQSKMIYK